MQRVAPVPGDGHVDAAQQASRGHPEAGLPPGWRPAAGGLRPSGGPARRLAFRRLGCCPRAAGRLRAGRWAAEGRLLERRLHCCRRWWWWCLLNWHAARPRARRGALCTLQRRSIAGAAGCCARTAARRALLRGHRGPGWRHARICLLTWQLQLLLQQLAVQRAAGLQDPLRLLHLLKQRRRVHHSCYRRLLSAVGSRGACALQVMRG